MKSHPDILLVAGSSARRRLLASLLRKNFPGEEPRVFPSLALSRTSLEQSSEESLLVADLDSSEDASTMIRHLQDFPGIAGAVVLIEDSPPGWVQAAIQAGAHAFLSRNPDAEDLQLAIKAAEAGLILLHPSFASNLVAQDLHFVGAVRGLERLTARESQVLRLISHGLGNKEIAARLDISEHTAKFHTSSILGKLGVASRTEAVSEGIKRGLIPI